MCVSVCNILGLITIFLGLNFFVCSDFAVQFLGLIAIFFGLNFVALLLPLNFGINYHILRIEFFSSFLALESSGANGHKKSVFCLATPLSFLFIRQNFILKMTVRCFFPRLKG